jgi:hypothetical protein
MMAPEPRQRHSVCQTKALTVRPPSVGGLFHVNFAKLGPSNLEALSARELSRRAGK